MEEEFSVTSDLVASAWQRFAHYLIDLVCIYIFAIILMFVIGFASYFINGEVSIDEMSDNQATLFVMVIYVIYFVVFEGIFSRSIAKFITKTIIVDEAGNKPQFSAILGRTFCRIIPFDFLSFLGSPSRGWHDSIPGTYVVKKELLEEAKQLHYSFDTLGKKEEDLT